MTRVAGQKTILALGSLAALVAERIHQRAEKKLYLDKMVNRDGDPLTAHKVHVGLGVGLGSGRWGRA